MSDNKLLNIEDLEQVDLYFDDHIEELLTYGNDDIIKFILDTKQKFGYSLTDLSLGSYLSNETIGIMHLFDENEIDVYLKNIDLINRLNYSDYGLGFTLGDYYLEKGDKENALYHYKNTFKNGYNLNKISYFYSLERYLSLVDNKVDILVDLIDASIKEKICSIDFAYTYLLLIKNLEMSDSRYIEYIDKAITMITPMVREYQSKCRSRDSLSDSDEERNLCELLSLNFEYLVESKKYIEAYDVYKKLTEEIGLSDCMRYYHFRDKVYWDMISYMKDEHPELCFFDDRHNARYSVVTEIDNINDCVGKTLMLKNDKGLTLQFIIKNVYKEKAVTIVPILPIIGEGGLMFTTIVYDDKNIYLESSFNF